LGGPIEPVSPLNRAKMMNIRHFRKNRFSTFVPQFPPGAAKEWTNRSSIRGCAKRLILTPVAGSIFSLKIEPRSFLRALLGEECPGEALLAYNLFQVIGCGEDS